MSGSQAVKAKEMVQKGWLRHRAAFRVERLTPSSGGDVIMVIDGTSRPGGFFLFGRYGDEPILAVRGLIPDDVPATIDAGVFADRVIGGAIPGEPMPFNEVISMLALDGRAAGGLALHSFERFAAALDDPRLSARLPKDGLVASEMKRFDAAGVEPFRAHFNQDVFAVLAAADNVRWRDYAFYNAPGEVGAIRRQAARYFPTLSSFIVNRFSVRNAVDSQVAEKAKTEAFLASEAYRQKLDSLEVRNGVSRTVKEWMQADGRDPFPAWLLSEKAVRQAVQTVFGADDKGQPRVPMPVLANLRGVQWPTNGVPIERIITSLAELPPDWFPKTREDWDAFCDLTDTVGKYLSTLSGRIGANGQVEPVPLRVLYEGCQGKWANLRERFMRSYVDQRLPEGTTEADAGIVESGVDWEGMAALPRDKRLAAAMETVERLSGLSEWCPKGEMANWIVRRIEPDMSRPALRNACLEVEEMLDAFARRVIIPLAANEVARATRRKDILLAEQHNATARMAAARILVSGKSAVRLMEMVRAYINRSAEIAGATEADEGAEDKAVQAEARRQASAMLKVGVDPDAPIPPDGWAPLCAVVEAPNGVTIVPLTSKAMLEDEGRARSGSSLNKDGSHGLRICVGESGMPYFKRCQLDGEHILSFRVPGGRDGVPYTRLSCLQVGSITHGKAEKLRVIQHRGRENASPPAASEVALTWLQNAIMSGTVKLNFDGVRDRMGMFRSKKVDTVYLACGYDWKNRHLVEKALTPWQAFFNKRFKKMTVNEFALEDEVQSMVTALAPTLDSVAAAPAIA